MKALEKLLKRTRNSLMALGLSGALMWGASGCETMNSADWLALGLGGIARDENKTEKERKSAAYLEQIAREQAKRKHERDIAERNKDETKQEINIYIEKEKEQQDGIRAGKKPPENYVERKKEPENRGEEQKQRKDEYAYFDREKIGKWIAPPPSYACTGIGDRNKDGYIGRDELQNLGNYFEFGGQDYLKIILGSSWRNIKGKTVIGKVTETESGKILLVDNKDENLMSNAKSRWMPFIIDKSKDRGIKIYTLEWLVEGKLIPTRTINFLVNYEK